MPRNRGYSFARNQGDNMTTHMKLTLHHLNDGHDMAIIHDTLPEVYDSFGTPEASMGSDRDGEYSVCIRYRDNNTAGWYYRAALCNLAMWQHVLGEPARIAAAEEDAQKEMAKRTKELADIIEGVIVDDRAIRPELIAAAILSFQKEQEPKP